MELYWMQCQGDVWCRLNNVNLEHDHFSNLEGVYIIWHGGKNASTVRVGQGRIKDRLLEHRNDPEIQQYNHLELYVTWANVPTRERDGVEKYLGEHLTPLVGDRFPDTDATIVTLPHADPIEVNLPW